MIGSRVRGENVITRSSSSKRKVKMIHEMQNEKKIMEDENIDEADQNGFK